MNPLIAIYFACQPSPKSKQDGELIAVKIDDVGVLSEEEMGRGPFQISGTKFVFPSVVAPRIASQRGLFSVHANPDKRWILRDKTERFSIMAEDKQLFLDNLFGLGVDAAMIMADLDGISANLKWRYNSRKSLI